MPKFRNPELYQVLPIRTFFRGECGFEFPSGGQGFVVEDLDLLFRWYGPQYGQDADGRFRLAELKYESSTIRTAQRKTFGLMDRILQRGDPDGLRYDGFYLIQLYPNPADPDDIITANTRFVVNGEEMTTEQFRTWSLNPRSTVPSYFANN